MKKVLIILLFLFTKLHADDFKLEKIINGLERPGVYHLLIIKTYS